MKLAHIINVAEINERNKKSYLDIAQPLTLCSMLHARKCAKPVVDVELFAIKHQSETVPIPDGFTRAPDIATYAWQHIDALHGVEPKLPLPRIADIITPLYQLTDAEFIIYTNLDIGLYPQFYAEVATLIGKGYDAFCINRRDLPKIHNGQLLDENALDTVFALKGVSHLGIDCFVFRREIVPQLRMGHVYVGFPPIGQVLKTQVERNSKRFAWFKNLVLTFHIGSDQPWNLNGHPYYQANMDAAAGLYENCFEGKPIWAGGRRLLRRALGKLRRTLVARRRTQTDLRSGPR